jgi:hypothetical protein
MPRCSSERVARPHERVLGQSSAIERERRNPLCALLLVKLTSLPPVAMGAALGLILVGVRAVMGGRSYAHSVVG